MELNKRTLKTKETEKRTLNGFYLQVSGKQVPTKGMGT